MALRSAHFERDFKGGPKVLLWGDVEGMRGLRDFLRQLQTAEAPRTLTSLCEAADGKEITVVSSGWLTRLLTSVMGINIWSVPATKSA